MTRRQLIQSLALVAAGAVPGASALAQNAAQRPPAAPIPQAFEPASWKTVWLDHISYAVADYRKSTAFYRDLMGWKIRNDNGTSQCTLDINGIGGIIIRNRRAPAEGQSGGSTGGPAPQSTAGASAATAPAAGSGQSG